MKMFLPRSGAWAWVAVVVVTIFASAGLKPAERGGVLAGLRPGLPVMLTETGGRFEIGLLPGVPGPMGHEILAVGEDHVVVRDFAGVTEIWIPIFSIACVKTISVSR